MPGLWRGPVSRQSHAWAPPGKSFASLKGGYPSTSSRPHDRRDMRGLSGGRFMVTW